jgi:hypothetical protein
MHDYVHIHVFVLESLSQWKLSIQFMAMFWDVDQQC